MTDQKNDKPFVYVDWMPGETGLPKDKDQKPSPWSFFNPFIKSEDLPAIRIYARENEKLQFLVNELMKTDPELVAKAAKLWEESHEGDYGKMLIRDGDLQGSEAAYIASRKNFGGGRFDALGDLDKNNDKKVTVDELRAELKKFVVEEAGHSSNLTPKNVPDVRGGDKSRTV
jgi:hypothetical protein